MRLLDERDGIRDVAAAILLCVRVYYVYGGTVVTRRESKSDCFYTMTSGDLLGGDVGKNS